MSVGVGAIGEPASVRLAALRADTKPSGGGDFGRALAAASEGREASWQRQLEEQRAALEDPERVARAQKGAEQLVAATFIIPILQQLRDTNMAAEPFGPGMYEKRLGPMLDAQIADRIVSAQRLPIVDAIRDNMLGVRQSRVDGRDGIGGSVDDRNGAKS